jgi:hypothetical protein
MKAFKIPSTATVYKILSQSKWLLLLNSICYWMLPKCIDWQTDLNIGRVTYFL